ncbi:MAG: amidotransferase [Desulfobacterales bacterium]|nr:amidotransferase [Deltaproteobacteria bacterium]NNK97284.1 amidotransferase [Desulfobacterales bacterium]
MKIHWLQHVPFEGLGSISDWVKRRGHPLSCTRFWARDTLPEPDSLELLIVMGGPMGIYEEDIYPWLAEEKLFIRSVVERGVGVLGICLGAQLLADVFGARVYPNSSKEIGWYPVAREDGDAAPLRAILPETIEVLHWHGDTFDIPAVGQALFSSEACRNQGFMIGDRIIALQYHLEMTQEALMVLVENCRGELSSEGWVQNEEEIFSHESAMIATNHLMDKILDYFELYVCT